MTVLSALFFLPLVHQGLSALSLAWLVRDLLLVCVPVLGASWEQSRDSP